MRYFRFVVHAPRLLIMCLFLTVAHAEGGRVKVAILDGVPVYHWTAFKSVYRNDIDRALILRDFRRQFNTLPQRFIDEGIEIKIAADFGGDRRKLIEALKREGETFGDFRQFIAEEIILQAMRKRETNRSSRSEAEWLASLRKGARIQTLKKPSLQR
jgi:hypothetical protein